MDRCRKASHADKGLSLERGPQSEPHLSRTFINRNTIFACNLYKRLSLSARRNVFFSPYSISAALGMAWAGTHGDTHKQISETLGFSFLEEQRVHEAFAGLRTMLDKIQGGGVTLHVANALWPQPKYPLLRTYTRLLARYYGTEITAVDFGCPQAVAQTINDWAANCTSGRIRDIAAPDSFDSFTRLVLVNVAFFYGRWQYQFNRGETTKAVWHKTPTRSVQVPTMQLCESLRYAEVDECQALELPYVGEALAMLILLPRKINGLAELEKGLSVDKLKLFRQMLDRQKVKVFLPRFRVSNSIRLSGALRALGIRDAFQPGTADFSGIDGSDWLYLGEIIHRAGVDCREDGTEAFVSTASLVRLLGGGEMEPVFRADHPFVFLIQDAGTGTVLFMGRLADPSRDSCSTRT